MSQRPGQLKKDFALWSMTALGSGGAGKPSSTTKVTQPRNLPQVLGFGKVATISRHQHRARNRQCHGVIKRVKQVVVKLASQFNGSGVGYRGRCPGDVELG